MSTQDSLQDDNWLIDDTNDIPADIQEQPPTKKPWKVLIVDDEKDIFTATRLAIQDIRYKERGLQLLHASSGKEGFEMMSANPDTALVLLDVVMESDDAGLLLVRRIRSELNNHSVRIVLRTGQPGQAPEQEVILDYDIDDYKTKTELTEQKLLTTVISSLRAFESLLAIEKHRQGLAKILEGASDLYQLHSLKEFASGVLKQVSTLLNVGKDGILCVESVQQNTGRLPIEVIAATGSYEPLSHSNDLSGMPELADAILEAFREKSTVYHHPYDVLYITSQNAREFVVHFSPPWPLEELDRKLLEVFCQRISAAYDNLYLYRQLHRSQEATVVALADLAEFRDMETGQHVLRVQKLVDALSRELSSMQAYKHELTPQFMDMIGMASILHDVGKIGTPDHILFKPGRLDPEERAVMQQHAMIGAVILQKAAEMVDGSSYLSLGTEIAAGHHEHYDGQGYPKKLQGADIPLSARIVAVVDVFDALLNQRTYKPAWTLEATMDYIKERAGSQFDPKVVEALVKLVDEKRLPFVLGSS
jgi:response regulator RpfG family c-di-GMP phosphodiesterase